MQNVDKLNPPIQYKLIWLLIGLAILLLIAAWYGLVFWLSRRKKLKSLDGLKRLAAGWELNRLKAKYLQLIEELYQRYQRKEITLRELHIELSMLVRSFVQEASFFPAPFLTLSDLRNSSFPKLAQLIATYYPAEFAAIENGDAASSVQAAKGLVQQWPY
jgi:hypothetical protein